MLDSEKEAWNILKSLKKHSIAIENNQMCFEPLQPDPELNNLSIFMID
jgi:hypothetical protein